MKANAIARIVLYSLLALVLSAVLVVGILIGNLSIDFGRSGGTTVESEVSLDAADIRKFEIDWASGAVTINVADTDQITIREQAPENSKYKMTYDINGSTLELSYGARKISFGFGDNAMPSKDLVITVPRDWVCQQIEIDGAALTIHIQHLTVEKIDLDGASNVLEFVGNVETVDIDGAANNIHLNCENHPTLIDIDGASCELDLILPKGCGFAVEMDGLSCNFHSDLKYTTKNGLYIYGNGHTNVNADGISCDVTVSESAECAHVWDAGQELTPPGGGLPEMVYTCKICGETKSEPIPHTTHTWDSGTALGDHSIVYTCTQCGKTKTVTVEAKRHGFVWVDSFTRELLEDQIFEPGYYAGAEIVFKTGKFMDVDLELWCDGVFVCKQTEVGDHWEFYFTMPDHIVYIQLKTSGGGPMPEV